MKSKIHLLLLFTIVLLAGVGIWMLMTQAVPGSAFTTGSSPSVVAYQGEVSVSGSPYSGDGYFKFAVVSAAGNTSHWSNDGTSTNGSEPTAAVSLTVNEGLFSVLLGDTTLDGMTQALTADVFSQPDRYLRVWFSESAGGPINQLNPDTRIAAVPYALQAQEAVNADTVDGLHASELGAQYQNVVVVAKSGGDFTSVQSAIDSITDADLANTYLVWVAPGVYSETVQLKPGIHLQGAGQDVTKITSNASSSAWPPDQATVILANAVSLRDLTVQNRGTGTTSVAVLGLQDASNTRLNAVRALASGSGDSKLAIMLSGGSSTFQEVSAWAQDGSVYNIGLLNAGYAFTSVHGGSFTGLFGEFSRGISNIGSSIVLEHVTARGANAVNVNMGMDNRARAVATLTGGSYTGSGGSVQAVGVSNALTSTMTAVSVTALAENGGPVGNYGIANYKGSEMTLVGGHFTARGGEFNYAVSNEDNVTLEATDVTARAERGSGHNNGLWNTNGAQATVFGGSFYAYGGPEARGITNAGITTTLTMENSTALGEWGTGSNYGLKNYEGAYTTLKNSAFTGFGNGTTYGIYNEASGTLLSATNCIVEGDDGSTNYGLFNEGGASANITQSVLEGGTNSAVCSSCNGPIKIHNSRLIDGAVSGNARCVLVTRGTTVSTDGATCP